jgi:tRNA 2-thiouridine synthesizing protein D
MVKFAFLICTAPYTFQNTDTLLQMIEAAYELGHSVSGVFFFIDGVINASRKIKVEKTVRNLPNKLQEIIRKGVSVAICSACAEYRGIEEEDLATGIQYAGLMTFGDMVSSADRLVTFGL